MRAEVAKQKVKLAIENKTVKMENRFFSDKDKLLVKEQDEKIRTTLENSPDQFMKYSVGYRDAALRMIKNCKESHLIEDFFFIPQYSFSVIFLNYA